MTELQLTTFRGRVAPGKWFVGNYYCHNDGKIHLIYTPNGRAVVDPNTVGIRVDGIHDKNGKDIFVGDILEITLPRNLGTLRGKVIYCHGEFVIVDLTKHHYAVYLWDGDSEVIGNIHDNPELLENKR